MNKEENVLYGGPSAPKIDDKLNNLGEIFLKKLKEYTDQVLIICGKTESQRTAAELRWKSIRLAECLRYLGVRPGDTISISSENQLEFPVVFLATLYIGGKISAMNPAYTEIELNHVLNLTKPKILFSTNANIKNVAKIATEKTFIQHIITFEQQTLISNSIDYNSLLLDKKIPSNDQFKCSDISDNDTVVILISSGTTGLPKGVEITYHNMISYFQFSIVFIQNIKETLGSLTMLNVLPWFHTFGLFSSMASILNGQSIITMPKFIEKKYLEIISTYKVQVLFVVPPILVFLAKSPLVKTYDLSSVQVIISGAAPLRKETIDELRPVLSPSVIFTQGYGLSETTIGILVQKETFYTPGSVGILYPGTWGKVIDVETGKNLGPNQEGELCFKGDFIMKGYINNKTATKETIDENGWLHTGDIGYYDTNGEWFIVDRIKELIKYKGYQVPPAELESLLLMHPRVADAAVIGIPDEKAGELPLAFVVKKPGEHVIEKEIVDFVASKISKEKQLRGGVRFIASIPKNPTGKILRRVLRDSIVKEKFKL